MMYAGEEEDSSQPAQSVVEIGVEAEEDSS